MNPRIKKRRGRSLAKVGVVVGGIVIAATVSILDGYLPNIPVSGHPFGRQLFTSAVLPLSIMANSSEGGVVECETVSLAEASDQCAFVREHCSGLASLINYLELIYCPGPVPRGAVCLALVGWLALVVSLLATTADFFFVPALEFLSFDMLHLSPEVAGITLLALGNGAPDVFGALAGMGQDDLEVVLGSLVGASAFVSTVVLGSVILAASPPAKVHRGSFRRDVLAYLFTVMAIVSVASGSNITVFHALGLLSLYVGYVTIVIMRSNETKAADGSADDSEVCSTSVTSAHKGSLGKNGISSSSLEARRGMDGERPVAPPQASNISSLTHGQKDAWQKLRLEIRQTDCDASVEAEDVLRVTNTFQEAASNWQREEIAAQKRAAMAAEAKLRALAELKAAESDELEAIAATNRGGVDDSQVIWLGMTNRVAEGGGSSTHSFTESDDSDIETSSEPPSSSKVRKSQGENMRKEKRAARDDGEDNEDNSGLAGLVWPRGSGCMIILYRMQILAEGPFTLMRWASIPSADRKWDEARRWFAVISPIGLTTILLFDIGGTDVCSSTVPKGWLLIGGMPVGVVALLISATISLWLIPATRITRGEYSSLLHGVNTNDETNCEAAEKVGGAIVLPKIYPVLVIGSFAGSILWMDIVATELVALMEAVGVGLGISTAILGLTVLALGNSIGDLISDTSVARAGQVFFLAPIFSHAEYIF